MNALPAFRAGPGLFPARQLSDSPAFRLCRRRTGQLLADKRRLEFLRALDLSAAPLTAGEAGFLHGLFERARQQHYHYALTDLERTACDRLRRRYGANLWANNPQSTII